MSDPTMEKISLNGSVRWAAARIGWTLSKFRQKRDILENDGFPKVDRITNLYVKADVDAWINRRRQLSDNVVLSVGVENTIEEVNFGAL
ncbi:MAG: hypothetical protein BM560_14600 [Roseobacter sp. MedPE-SWde]|mgnify:CR=1 FL=1|nr:MAG: hypothetical protein BM560_14600 [Roseobacter sp. MedPE-SWde]